MGSGSLSCNTGDTGTSPREGPCCHSQALLHLLLLMAVGLLRREVRRTEPLFLSPGAGPPACTFWIATPLSLYPSPEYMPLLLPSYSLLGSWQVLSLPWLCPHSSYCLSDCSNLLGPGEWRNSLPCPRSQCSIRSHRCLSLKTIFLRL